MSDFHDVSFPMRLSRGATCNIDSDVEVIQLASGREIRQRKWSNLRRSWDVGGAVSDLASLRALVSFFEARSGPIYGFRFRDPLDHSSASQERRVRFDDQPLGIGDGVEKRFQLMKRNGSGSRTITKPVAGSVHVGINGIESAAGWSVDPMTGLVTFATPPEIGDVLTSGFTFDCPVRFGANRLQAVIEAFGAGRALSVSLLELPVST